MFKWLTGEADRRGIWVLQGFYNIHLSHTFARAHIAIASIGAGPGGQRVHALCISEFVREYPNVGLIMTLGEALAPQ